MQVKVTCPNCGKELKAAQELRGKRVACPSCNESFRVGGPPEVPPAPPPVGAGAPPLQVVPPPLNRPAQAARFIAEETAETRVQLGADGRLPELKFEARAAESDPREPQAGGSNPLLLVGVLCFSVTLSVILLVFEPPKAPSNEAAKAAARNWIQAKYIGSDSTPQPHELRLRWALQAAVRGDTASERRLYREVLNMLHDESLRGAAGVTGPRVAAEPPNDRHLEEQLAILLSGD